MGGETAKRETQVEAQVNRMNKGLEELADAMARLEGALTPCLRKVPTPAPPPPPEIGGVGAEKAVDPALVPLASALRISNDQILAAIKRARKILDRIEL